MYGLTARFLAFKRKNPKLYFFIHWPCYNFYWLTANFD